MVAFIKRQPKALRIAALVLVAIAVPGGCLLAAAIYRSTK